MAIDMFCGKRHEEESSNKGLQLLLRFLSSVVLLVVFVRKMVQRSVQSVEKEGPGRHQMMWCSSPPG